MPSPPRTLPRTFRSKEPGSGRLIFVGVVASFIASYTVATVSAADLAQTRPEGAPKLAVLDMELTGDTGGPAFEAEHAARLEMASTRLRQELRQSGHYHLVDLSPASGLLDELRSRQAYLHDCNGCDLDVGRSLGADEVMVTWVNRVSGLILTLTYEIHDVASGQIAMRKSYDFRGDNDAAWNHAIKYMVRDLTQPATSACRDPDDDELLALGCTTQPHSAAQPLSESGNKPTTIPQPHIAGGRLGCSTASLASPAHFPLDGSPEPIGQ